MMVLFIVSASFDGMTSAPVYSHIASKKTFNYLLLKTE